MQLKDLPRIEELAVTTSRARLTRFSGDTGSVRKRDEAKENKKTRGDGMTRRFEKSKRKEGSEAALQRGRQEAQAACVTGAAAGAAFTREESSEGSADVSELTRRSADLQRCRRGPAWYARLLAPHVPCGSKHTIPGSRVGGARSSIKTSLMLDHLQSGMDRFARSMVQAGGN